MGLSDTHAWAGIKTHYGSPQEPLQGISYYLLIGEKFAYLQCLFTHECLVTLLIEWTTECGQGSRGSD